jgi:hypothetical protein
MTCEGSQAAARQRPQCGNWEELLLPEIERQQNVGKEVSLSRPRRLRQAGDQRPWRSGA